MGSPKGPKALRVDSSTVHKRKSHGRSRIGNGTELLPFVDGRSVWARFMRDTFNSVVAHCGGEDYASELKRMQARRVAVLEAELIYLESKIAQHRAAGTEPPAATLDLYTRIANGQRRHCEALGFERTQRDVTPSLASIIDGKAEESSDA
jgi:hypothetical protein